MKKIFISISVLLSVIIILSSCEDNDPVSSSEDIIGSWTKIVTDTEGISYQVRLDIDQNSYDFIILSDVPGHTDSYAEYIIEDGMMKIIEDEDCYGIIGYYDFSVSGNKLTLTAVDDNCELRAMSLEGVWTAFE